MLSLLLEFVHFRAIGICRIRLLSRFAIVIRASLFVSNDVFDGFNFVIIYIFEIEIPKIRIYGVLKKLLYKFGSETTETLW